MILLIRAGLFFFASAEVAEALYRFNPHIGDTYRSYIGRVLRCAPFGSRLRNALFNADECLDNYDSFIRATRRRPPSQTDARRATDWMNSDNGSFDQNSKPIIYNNVDARRRVGIVGVAPELNRECELRTVRRLPSSEHSS